MYTMTDEQILYATDAQLKDMLKAAVKERERILRSITSQYRVDLAATVETVRELHNVAHWEDMIRGEIRSDAVKRMAWNHHH